ncbi:hypothetical protein WN71_026855 [Streptomyces mangrovisoli]|uniref:Secreted protein n=1 Tax=Streptomyces mangrovisoli TaxID=1428628 RepID=A0A1J4NR29_9ACTN|nr:hypothetical protein WN71_026855 [Streptomyces mangrovisoli]
MSAEAPAEEPGKPRRRLGARRIVAIAASVVVLGAVAGGVGYTVDTVRSADVDAGAPVWKLPKQAKDTTAKKADAKGLLGALVPFGTDDWNRGPDLDQFGAEVDLTGRQATELSKQALKDLPRTQRKQLEKAIDDEHIKGIAMRSYVRKAVDVDATSDTDTVLNIELAEMPDARNSTEYSEFLTELGVFRKGPAIKGFPHAKCFLPSKDAKEKLDGMYCSAVQGDVAVTLHATGAKPLQTKEVAQLLQQQLERIKDPGKAV